MSTRISIAVMHCTEQQPKEVIDRSVIIRDQLYTNTSLYPAPPVTRAVFEAQLNAATALLPL